MPSKIKVLNDHTINQIAAGEVIENPASVVKELVENAIDALATDICIEITGGGRQLIRISDNGCGMGHDDAILCLERHATSKINDAEDIFSVGTMGFRGEAIPSIASISKFTLLTNDGSSDSDPLAGTFLIVDGGKLLSSASAARSPGTTVEVKQLFFNLPVRRKFQKSPAYDANEILRVVTALSLGHPYIRFELIHNSKTMLNTTATPSTTPFIEAIQTRMEELLGEEFTQNMMPVDVSEGAITLQGFICRPHYSRPNRTGQYLYINRRAVTSPFISFQLRDGYGTAMGTGRFPAFILHLSLPTGKIDVNVHPQKREVRLRIEESLKVAIARAVDSALHGSSTASPFAGDAFDGPSDKSSDASMLFTPSFGNFDLTDHSSLPSQPFPPPPSADWASWEYNPPTVPLEDETAQNQETLFEEETFKTTISLPVILAVIKSFILLEPATLERHCPALAGGSDGICILNQRAAHSRVIFEKLCKAADSGATQLQPMLLPFTFELATPEANTLSCHAAFFKALAIEIREIGPRSYNIEAVPDFLADSDIILFVKDLLHNLEGNDPVDTIASKREQLLARAALRTAIGKELKLTHAAAHTLVAQWITCKAPFQCPMGKPLITYLSHSDLERGF